MCVCVVCTVPRHQVHGGARVSEVPLYCAVVEHRVDELVVVDVPYVVLCGVRKCQCVNVVSMWYGRLSIIVLEQWA